MISRVGVCGSSVASDVVMTSRIAVVNLFATVTVSVFVASTVDAVSFAAVEYSISTQGGVGGKLLLLREGRIGLQWRGERRTINTQGGVGGGCISKCF